MRKIILLILVGVLGFILYAPAPAEAEHRGYITLDIVDATCNGDSTITLQILFDMFCGPSPRL